VEEAVLPGESRLGLHSNLDLRNAFDHHTHTVSGYGPSTDQKSIKFSAFIQNAQR